ncbi:MAG: transglycosylase SLT domain-containing protein [Pyrinomonadaceae bacterium]
MVEVVLTYPTPEGSQEIAIEGERTSFGRGSEADHYFTDEGLSRLHATIYREGDRVWVVDENSTNGTFVNGVETAPAGTPLSNGDSIKIGHHTVFNVHISETGATQNAPEKTSGATGFNPVVTSSTASTGEGGNYLIPIAVIAFAVLIIGISGVFIGINVFGTDKPEVTRNSGDKKRPTDRERKKPNEKDSGKPDEPNKPGKDETPGGNKDETPPDTPEENKPVEINLPPGKSYQELSESEKDQYVEARALKVAQMIGNRSVGSIPPEAVKSIRKYVDQYNSRRNSQRSTGTQCRMGGNLEQTYERASQNAPFIIKNFNASGLDPQVGLYLAMIESEHCNCLQSRSGPLGMFQFAKAAARENGLQVKDNASTTNPDERCEPEPASKAAAKYMKTLSGRFGTGPLSIPLAIASYNSGQGALSNNLEKALKSGGNQQRSFWTLVSNADSLSDQFQSENIRYVPKFFAAAIIGENPQDFGMKLQPISTYTKEN